MSPAAPHRGEHGAASPALARNNARLKRLRRLVARRNERDDAGVVVVEGPTLVAEALDAHARIEEIFHESGTYPELVARADTAGVEVRAVVADVLGPILSTVTPQPIVAVVRREVADVARVTADCLREGRPVLVLAGVADPGNAGGLLRTAEAAGVAGVIFTEGSVDPFAPKVVRASAGSVLRVPVVVGVGVDETLAALGEAGVLRLTTSAGDGLPPESVDLTRPVALVLGNEAHGVAPSAGEQVDEVVSIPMAGATESLNVAVAGAVTLFEGARQRRTADAPAVSSATLIAGAAHEIRSPLSAVKGFTSVLVDRWDRYDDTRRKAMLVDVAAEADRLDRIITEVLDLSRLDSGHLRLDRQPVDLARLAADARARVTRDHPDVEVALDLDGTLDEVDGFEQVIGDRARLERIVVNLVENAVKYGEGADVRLQVGQTGEVANLTVSDRGPGFGAEALQALSDPTRDTSGARPTGTGLGLWLGTRLAEAHGGSLSVDSTPGGGARVTLTLPLDRGATLPLDREATPPHDGDR